MSTTAPTLPGQFVAAMYLCETILSSDVAEYPAYGRPFPARLRPLAILPPDHDRTLQTELLRSLSVTLRSAWC